LIKRWIVETLILKYGTIHSSNMRFCKYIRKERKKERLRSTSKVKWDKGGGWESVWDDPGGAALTCLSGFERTRSADKRQKKPEPEISLAPVP
jgi:hypothetical protein